MKSFIHRIVPILAFSAVACSSSQTTTNNEEPVSVPTIPWEPHVARPVVKKEDPDPRQHQEKAGGFSYILPDNWKMQEIPDTQFKVCHRPGSDTNICIVDVPFSGPLDEFVTGGAAGLRQMFPKARKVNQHEFETSAGLQGCRLLIQNRSEGLLRQTMYIFNNGEGTYYVLTCSTQASGGEKYDTIFEKSMKTFRFEKP